MSSLNRKKAPGSNAIKDIHFLDVKQTKLDNNIIINCINGGSQEILKIDFIFNAGNRFQNKALVASSTSQLLKEGTKSYTAFQISEGIDNYGAFFEVQNSYDTATLTLYTLTKHLNNVLPYVKEVILFPKFSKNEFEIFKNNALERFKINLEKASFLARKEFMSMIFGASHPYGSPVNLVDYKNLSVKDLSEFYNANYNLGNCRILISGKVTQRTIKSLNTFFGQEETTTNKLLTGKKEITPDTPAKLFIQKKDALQSAIRIGRILPNKLHQDYFGLQILNTILGGYFGSRLMKNIREDKGYSYGISSGIISLKESGYLFISTEVRSDVTQNALDEIYKEIELLRTKEVSIGELDLVKNYMLGHLLKSCDGPFNMASLFESAYEYGLDYDFYNKYITAIKNTTSKTIMELGIKYLDKNSLKEIVVGKL